MIERIHEGTNWNSTFMNPNTILERMSKKFGISKKELLDSEHENPAVIQAACEKEILDEVYEYFTICGFNLEAI